MYILAYICYDIICKKKQLKPNGNSNFQSVTTASVESTYFSSSVYKCGNTVQFQSGRNLVALTANTDYVVGTIPDGYRPVAEIGSLTLLNRSGVIGYLSIGANGTITLRPYADLPASDYAYLKATWATKL